MTIVLPVDPARAPTFRALVRATWGADEATPWLSATDWITLAEYDPTTPELPGYELLYVRRRSLPELGTAAFRMVYGRTSLANDPFAFPPLLIAPDITSLKKYEVRIQLKEYGAADSTYATVFLGYVDYEMDENYPGSDEGLMTRVFYVVDTLARTQKWPMNRHTYDRNPGSGETPPPDPPPMPPVPLDPTVRLYDCYGHPGYNYSVNGDGILFGNRSPNQYYPLADPRTGVGTGGCSIYAHVWQGAYSLTAANPTDYYWTDYQAVQHATGATRPYFEPWFRLNQGSADAYDSYNSWSIGQDESVFEFLIRVCNRRRGLGSVTSWWLDNVSGAIEVGLHTCPPFYDDLTNAPIPAGTGFPAISITGAGSVGGLVYDDTLAPIFQTWDLINDHRLIDEQCQISDAEMNQFDYVETVGEQIEVATTLSLADTTAVDVTPDNIYDPNKQVSLAPRWTTNDRTDIEAATIYQRTVQRYNNVYQEYSLPFRWDCTVGNQLTPGKVQCINYMVTDTGVIGYTPLDLISPLPTFVGPSTVEILSYLPFYTGYLYNGTKPARSGNVPETSFPTRRPAMPLFRTMQTGEDRWVFSFGTLPQDLPAALSVSAGFQEFSPTLEIHPDAIYLYSQFYTQQGTRFFGVPARPPIGGSGDVTAALESVYSVLGIAITVGIKFPQRVRFCDVAVTVPPVPYHPWQPGMHDWRKVRRKKTFYVPGCHLWLASSNCIWDLDGTDFTLNGFKARRTPLGSVVNQPAILRDDRPRLQFYHLLLREWYLNPRTRIKVAKRYCGLLPYARVDGMAIVQSSDPGMNQFIKQVLHNDPGTGMTPPVQPVGTPITFLDYDHQEGITTWATDWYEIMVSGI